MKKILMGILYIFGVAFSATLNNDESLNLRFYPDLGSDESFNFRTNLEKIISHSNRLVRENNFEAADTFYQKAFAYIDSNIENDYQITEFDQDLIEKLESHYKNYEKILEDIDFDNNNNFFCYGMNEVDIEDFHPDSFFVEFNKKVEKYIEYYSRKGKNSFLKSVENSQLYLSEVKKVLKSYNIPEDFAYLPIIESGYNPFAHSYAYASGLWQFVAKTGEIYGLSKNWWIDERRDVLKSTNAAAKHLKDLYMIFGEWNLVLAAYNAGPGKVKNRIKKQKTKNFWKLWTLPKQTKEYVPKFHAVTEIMRNPAKYNLDFGGFEKTVYDTIQLDSCVNLNTIAKSADIEYERLKFLNPQFRQWCLPPDSKNYPVIIPALSKPDIRVKLKNYSPSEIYAVKKVSSENLSKKKLAEKYKISLSAIEELNKNETSDTVNVVIPPVNQTWFSNFNKKFLSFYDNEKYFLDCQKKLNYRVRKGDSIWKIAKMFNVNINKLKGWNKIGKMNLIKPGQNLVIYL
ncbi:MAG: transglycosylase SLT domain-containing protein [Candidatus Delongbacteria bacterium]|nr:transglycosylase SLT domain-containing protein [Candidatus Delongbacteria bacterium]MBN2834512.1 transglycosylase SLT domain-containing protein [Candidatus Delongbacteria bacterium]